MMRPCTERQKSSSVSKQTPFSRSYGDCSTTVYRDQIGPSFIRKVKTKAAPRAGNCASTQIGLHEIDPKITGKRTTPKHSTHIVTNRKWRPPESCKTRRRANHRSCRHGCMHRLRSESPPCPLCPS